MKITITSLTDMEMCFKWKGTNASLANCLRRTILSEVPTLAIEDVVIDENESPMSDEQIAHVLGLIPLTTPPGKYVFPEDCDKKREDQRCRATLSLDLQAGNDVRPVMSGDLISDDEDVKPVSPNILITKLAPDKKLRLEAYAVLGKGRRHAKFQPVSTVYYKFQPILEIDLQRCPSFMQRVGTQADRVMLSTDGKTAIVELEDLEKPDAWVGMCPEDPSAIKVSYSPDTVVFTIESTGSIPAKRILEEALALMDETFNSISNLVKSETGVGEEATK